MHLKCLCQLPQVSPVHLLNKQRSSKKPWIKSCSETAQSFQELYGVEKVFIPFPNTSMQQTYEFHQKSQVLANMLPVSLQDQGLQLFEPDDAPGLCTYSPDQQGLWSVMRGVTTRYCLLLTPVCVHSSQHSLEIHQDNCSPPPCHSCL